MWIDFEDPAWKYATQNMQNTEIIHWRNICGQTHRTVAFLLVFFLKSLIELQQ